jgi:7-carboxy-7-deazaguanine synthase
MRLSEIYSSIQGEGLNAGTPTLFIRFAGCNLRCPGWPCDTPHAIFPEKYRHEWKTYNPGQLFEAISAYPSIQNICLTGGEPFVQQNDELCSLVRKLKTKQKAVECFSNGTIAYPYWAADLITFCMDWKLPGSGEDPFDQKRLINLKLLQTTARLQSTKFVISDYDDFCMAMDLWKTYIYGQGQTFTTFAGVAWGRMETAELVEWILKEELPWRLNIQVHNFIWDRTQRGI